eukprot:CAMPEP_0168249544 /NCGR_PEP_ID=MMETSP0141_2-20121125/2056_1 /TAXON_ID=44445 /ORGANISM="Pseudo-nitzschia australis, Strain 10249 10 AB" /LENGTH=573 /DNA_ID=CAMNT_0008185541 /DNA_START=83 /DNA_END=1803 /DNA_ORIENTATION=-
MKDESSRMPRKSKNHSQSWDLISSYETWTFIVLPVHIGYRVYLANRMPIMDCDEVFNYWEVVHFLLFRGKSLQTWEYANEFALRTYAYLTPIAGGGIFPYWLWSLLTEQVFDPSQSLNIAVFVLLRATFGASMAYAEVSFCRAIVEQGFAINDSNMKGNEIESTGKGVGKTVVATTKSWFLLVAVFYFDGHLAFVGGCLSEKAKCALLLFSDLCYIGYRLAFRCAGFGSAGDRNFDPRTRTDVDVRISSDSSIAMVIQGLVMFVDYQHYGRVVSPLWNILLYNTQAGGDELYGVEPFSYYVKNLLLNLNYVAPVGLAGFLPLIWSFLWSRSPSSTWKEGLSLMAPLYLWLTIVVPRPHKEERFLYPVYPSLCLGAAVISVSLIQRVLNHPWWTKPKQQGNGQKQKSTRNIQIKSTIGLAIIWLPALIISLSRTVALSKYYSAPLHVYAQMSVAIAKVNTSSKLEGTDPTETSTDVVCTCGEWYRFPSSFFIESKSSEVIFGFAPSTFTGQLPQPFTKEGSGIPKATTNQFNDKNEPEVGSHTPIESCDFLIELSTSLHSCIERSEVNHEHTQW